jgi:hypothetical protein
MHKIIESFDQVELKNDWKTQYRRYRAGRLKHQYWLWNRKSPDTALIDQYDHTILKNCQPGHTVFFGSAGYYLKDIFPEITVIEQFPIVKTFYPDVHICECRKNISKIAIAKADNFAMINNRAELWTNTNGLTDYLTSYTSIMNPGCRVFYSFRDTQMYVNRLTINMEDYFLQWAQELESKLQLKLVWHDINFRKKIADQNGEYDQNENPDTTNGNLKFWFVYQGEPWAIIS